MTQAEAQQESAEAPARPATPYELLGGSDVVGAIANRFYELMDSEPQYAELRALHAADLGPVRQGLIEFMNAWLGGPKDWFSRGKCVMSLHGPFAITAQAASQWADAMARAIADQPGVDRVLGLAMAERLGDMAMGLVNRGEGAKRG